MKPLYIALMLYAVFITGLADGLELAFAAISGIGIVIGLAVSFCINITMGSGLVLLLANNKMFHPKYGPFGIVVSAIPGLNSLPVWIALVGAGIVQKMGEEETGLTGMLARIAGAASSLSASNPVAALQSANTIKQAVQDTPQHSLPANNTAPTAQQRTSLELKSPNINRDVTPRVTQDNHLPTYVQKAA
jgi:hypothetical protein